jgi:hypothetical protein
MSLHNATFPDDVWDGSSDNRTDRIKDQGPDYRDWDAIVAELLAVQDFLLNGAGATVTGTPNGTGVALSGGQAQIQQVTLTLTNVSVATTDHTTAGAQGSLKVLDLPEGNIHVLGGVADLTIARVGTNLTATSAVVASVGSAAAGAGDATLTSTEADIIPSTSATLSGGAGSFKGASTGAKTLDGTGTPADIYLNFATPDAGSGGDDALLVNGTITLNFVNLGDHS